MKTIKSNVGPISFEHFAKTYLLMAKIALSYTGEGKDNISTDDKFRLNSGLIFIPVIFCIRHSVEVFLKSVAIRVDDKYYKTHDLKELEKILSRIKIPAEDVRKGIKIVDKYTHYKFPKKIVQFLSEENNIKFYDKRNEVFRFPENDIRLEIMGENLKNLKASDFQEDIENINSIFSKYSFWSQIEKHKK